jgi:hypothetical protein
MSWKSYAVVSGATVLAGWLASAPPSSAPESAAPVTRPATSAPVRESDIAQQAERLQLRARPEVTFPQPHRNLFRFGAGQADADRGGDIADVPPVQPETIAPAIPMPPPVKLSGVAEDQRGDRLVRTAILSSLSGVLLVMEGDEIPGGYRVSRIESEAVEIVRTVDGTTFRLTLSKSAAF